MNLFSIFRKQLTMLEDRLLTACMMGDIEEVSNCLKEGANMNRVCTNGRTPLGVIAQMGDIQLLKLFLNNSEPNIAEPSGSKESPSNLGYFIFVHKSDSSQSCDNQFAPNTSRYNLNSDQSVSVKSIDFDDFNDPLIQRIPWMPDNVINDGECPTPDGMENLEWDTEIHGEYVAQDQDPWAELYLWYASILSQTGALLGDDPLPDDINGCDQFGCAPLHYAAIEGKKEAIQLLIGAGCKVNVKDSDNYTPLHLAASKDRPEILELLIAKGANLNQRSLDGITALHVASSRGLLNNVRVLIEHGALVNAADLSDRTPLYVAVHRRKFEVVQYLISKGAKCNFADVHGYTPLFEAVCSKNVAMVQALLSAGATITQSHYLLHYSILHQQEAMVRVLVKAGCLLNVRDLSGNTPLMLAARAQSCSMVKFLLQNGASVQSVNSVSMHTVLQEVICFMTRSCAHFMKMFSILTDYGWEWELERNALSYSMLQKNRHAIASIVKRWDVVERETSLMEALIHRGELYLVQLFIQAGFDLHTVEPFEHFTKCDVAEPCREFVIVCLMQPKSLKELSRIRIRRSLKKNIFKKVKQLHLPPPLQAYLRLEDLPCRCELKSR